MSNTPLTEADYCWLILAILAIPLVGGLGAIGEIIGLVIKRRQPIFVAPTAV